jgi:hypothetical protein
VMLNSTASQIEHRKEKMIERKKNANNSPMRSKIGQSERNGEAGKSVFNYSGSSTTIDLKARQKTSSVG